MSENAVIDALDSDKIQKIIQRLASASPDCAPVVEMLQGMPLSDPPQAVQDELAKELLRILAENPQQGALIEKLAQDWPTTHRFEFGFGSASLMVAVAVLLRTHVRFEKRDDGTWSVIIEHKPMDSTLLKSLLDKLSQWL